MMGINFSIFITSHLLSVFLIQRLRLPRNFTYTEALFTNYQSIVSLLSTFSTPAIDQAAVSASSISS